MHKALQLAVLTIGLAASALAGPTLACHEWVSTPGSVFETLDQLRRTSMAADDSPANMQAARAKLAQLRADIKPGDPVSLMKAGYWAEVMHAIGISPDSDGPELMLRALALRPNDAEYEFMVALAHFDHDKATFQKHWNRAQELAKPGSVAAQNLELFRKSLAERGV
ncbi:MAG: hypothetical protein LAP61_16555 [Acidobacteriia bacterium]|nr:hypothetical protein [Terriglobia bacterium]